MEKREGGEGRVGEGREGYGGTTERIRKRKSKLLLKTRNRTPSILNGNTTVSENFSKIQQSVQWYKSEENAFSESD